MSYIVREVSASDCASNEFFGYFRKNEGESKVVHSQSIVLANIQLAALIQCISLRNKNFALRMYNLACLKYRDVASSVSTNHIFVYGMERSVPQVGKYLEVKKYSVRERESESHNRLK